MIAQMILSYGRTGQASGNALVEFDYEIGRARLILLTSLTHHFPYIVSQVPTDLQEVCFRVCVCTLSNILCFLKR